MCVLVFLENGLVPTLALACMRAGPRKFLLQMHPVSAMFANGLHRKMLRRILAPLRGRLMSPASWMCKLCQLCVSSHGVQEECTCHAIPVSMRGGYIFGRLMCGRRILFLRASKGKAPSPGSAQEFVRLGGQLWSAAKFRCHVVYSLQGIGYFSLVWLRNDHRYPKETGGKSEIAERSKKRRERSAQTNNQK